MVLFLDHLFFPSLFFLNLHFLNNAIVHIVCNALFQTSLGSYLSIPFAFSWAYLKFTDTVRKEKLTASACVSAAYPGLFPPQSPTTFSSSGFVGAHVAWYELFSPLRMRGHS